MIRQIAANYDLDEEATWLLAAIRRHENGRPGLEFGVGGPMNSGHRAHRYRDGVKSFYVQGYWAAGTAVMVRPALQPRERSEVVRLRLLAHRPPQGREQQPPPRPQARKARDKPALNTANK